MWLFTSTVSKKTKNLEGKVWPDSQLVIKYLVIYNKEN